VSREGIVDRRNMRVPVLLEDVGGVTISSLLSPFIISVYWVILSVDGERDFIQSHTIFLTGHPKWRSSHVS